ncbi:MAG: hypothetical protein K6A28_06460 [Bacteroidales bacterium]|nr:hypothetical protein [Bacteroidales bacterium]
MKRILLIATALMVAMLTSCGGLKHYEKVPAASMVPEARLHVGLDDLVLMGESTITVTSRNYFGFIQRVDKVNGVTFNPRNNTSVQLYGNTQMNIPGNLRYAAYKVLEEYPNADFYAPALYKEDVNEMFLGKITTQTMVVRAYKYKK